MICDGTAMDKTLFLSNLTTAQASLDLFLVMTPDSSYPNMNIVHYDYRRTRERGATIFAAGILAFAAAVPAIAFSPFTFAMLHTDSSRPGHGPDAAINPS